MGNKIEVGSKVKVVECGTNYSMYREWFKKFAPEFEKDFAEFGSVRNGVIGEVVAKHIHGDNNKRMLCAVKMADSKVYLLGEDGIKFVESAKTMGNGNFKVRCINTNYDSGLTKDKIYEFVNGYSKWDDGQDFPQFKCRGIDRFSDFNDLKKWIGSDDMFELVENKSVKGEETMENKFKVGDKVKILDGRKIDNYTCGWALGNMSEYVGKIATINSVHKNRSDKKIGYSVEEFGYEWDERGLELVNKNQQIIIYPNTTNRNETIAILKEGNEVVKTTKAMCNPTDTYDFKIGADWAVKRLLGIEIPTSVNVSATEIKEVKRQAKVGEWIKIISKSNVINSDRFKIGDILLVKSLHRSCGVDVEINGDLKCACHSQFVVLEGYQPTTYKEVKRQAKVGEYVKVVDAYATSGRYKNEDILCVAKSYPNESYSVPYIKADINGKEMTINTSEYVVLENYNPTEPVKEVAEPIPFKKAKIGDTIKIVKVAETHRPPIKIGQELTVAEIHAHSIYTERNIFEDKNEEYIIIGKSEPSFDISTISKSDLLAEISRRIGE